MPLGLGAARLGRVPLHKGRKQEGFSAQGRRGRAGVAPIESIPRQGDIGAPRGGIGLVLSHSALID